MLVQKRVTKPSGDALPPITDKSLRREFAIDFIYDYSEDIDGDIHGKPVFRDAEGIFFVSTSDNAIYVYDLRNGAIWGLTPAGISDILTPEELATLGRWLAEN